MATWFKVEGKPEEFSLPDKVDLAFLQAKVGGLIQFVTFDDGSALMVNEEGLLLGLPENAVATAVAVLKGWPEVLVGDAVFFSEAEMAKMEADEREDDEE